MSSSTTALNQSNQLIVHHEHSKLVVWNPILGKGSFTNSTGDSLTIPEGKVLGRITSGGALAICASGNSNGSQIPRFLNFEAKTVANGETVELNYVEGGDVDQNKIVFDGSDGLTTAVGTAGIMKDLLVANSRIHIVASTEMTAYDNS